MPFAQLVVGPPGSGKTTYVHGMQQLFRALQRQPCYVINLDPANDRLPYECHVNIFDLISLRDVMDGAQLGPNGGLLYCLEHLERSMDWLRDQIHALDRWQDAYFLVDCPGQVELFINHGSLRAVIAQLQKELEMRFCCVHLVDSAHCSDPSRFISVLLLSLQTMLHLELPHINVLSKMDLIRSQGELAFQLEYYTEVMDLEYLLRRLDEQDQSAGRGERFRKLNAAICELIEDFSLVSFHPLCIQDKRSAVALLRAIDKANGYVFGGLEQQQQGNASIMDVVAQSIDPLVEVAYMQERYVDGVGEGLESSNSDGS